MSDFCFIVPYRKRVAHMREFVQHMTRRFKAPIYFIEQLGDDPFNRGALLNAGFMIHGKHFKYCAYHDIDMLPNKADYSFPEVPTHLATHVQQFKWAMPPNYFGGVVLFSSADFHRCGGYSNHFWGWGGEDNEILFRLEQLEMPYERRDCWYQSLYHPRSHPTGFDDEKMAQARLPRAATDGYEFTDFEIMETEHQSLYIKTKIELCPHLS